MGSAIVVLGVIGNITAMIMFLSPLPTFVIIHRSKETGQFSAFPYVCTLMNCLLWFFYGLPMITENNTLVLTINGAGIVIESLYLILFLYYAQWTRKTEVLRILVFVIIFCAITFAITLGAFQGDDRTIFLGSINVIINTIMYAAPLSVMRMVIETKSVEYMPFMLSLCSFVNATLWALYGIMKGDKFIIIPNVLGVLLGALQLGLYAKYRKYKAPPATLSEEIAAAYTTEGATSTDLSDIITRGAVDLSDTITKGATSAGSGRFTQPTSPTSSITSGPKQAAQPGVDVKLKSEGSVSSRLHDSGRELAAARAQAPEAIKVPEFAKVQEVPKVPDASKVPEPSMISRQPTLQEVRKPPQEAPDADKVPEPSMISRQPTIQEVRKPPQEAPEFEDPAAKEKARKEQEAFAQMKAQEEKRADELRRLQEAYEEEEYGAELETIFL